MTTVLDRPAGFVPPAAPSASRRSGSTRWRVALRLAYRDARRSPGRSLLVIALIALPVFALSAADVLARTMQLSTAEQVQRDLGRAQAKISWVSDPGADNFSQSVDGQSYGSSGNTGAKTPPPPTTAQLLAALPPGSRLLPVTSGGVTVTTAYGIATIQTTGLAYQDPALSGLWQQVRGRAPQTNGEIAVTPALARRMGRTIGQSVADAKTRKTYTIVGIVTDHYHRSTQTAFVPAPPVPAVVTADQQYYVAGPEPVTWATVQRLNKRFMLVDSRSVRLRPPPASEISTSISSGTAYTAGGLTGAALVAGLVVLEIVLLAGPAFAVGARRSRRTLGLIGAVGGSRADLRNVVLAGGLVLGFGAGVLGLAGGAAVAVALLPLVAHWQDAVPGHLDLRLMELGGIVAVSVVTGLLAAWLPARAAARTDVLAALRGRRGTVRTRRSVPVIGALAASAGAVVAIGVGGATRNQTVLLAGAVLTELGLIACCPALIGLTGRLAARLPLAGRIALRDSARNRSATSSAVAAIMAAVAGGVGASILVASTDARDRSTYAPTLAAGYAYAAGTPTTAGNAAAVAALRTALPASTIFPLRGLPDGDPRTQPISAYPEAAPGTTYFSSGFSSGSIPSVVVDDGSTVSGIAGTSTPAGVAALRAGSAVVFDRSLIDHGFLKINVNKDAGDGSEQITHSYRTPAVLVAATYRTGVVVLPPATARAWALPITTVGFLVATARPPTDRQEQATDAALLRLGMNRSLYVERGYSSRYGVGLIALLVATSVIALGAALIATMLSTVDSRPDLQTLAAVGASPRIRRRLSAARAGTTALLGSALGVACGFIAPVGYVAIQRSVARANHDATSFPLAVPWWPNVAGALILVPALAAAAAYLFTRSRLPVERSAPS